jgi:hypothetical protein
VPPFHGVPPYDVLFEDGGTGHRPTTAAIDEQAHVGAVQTLLALRPHLYAQFLCNAPQSVVASPMSPVELPYASKSGSSQARRSGHVEAENTRGEVW